MVFAKIGRALGKVWEVGKRIGSFVARHHQHIAPLAMGLAQASGNQTAQKIAGVGLAASQMATMRQRLNESNARQAAAGQAGKPQPNAVALGVPAGHSGPG